MGYDSNSLLQDGRDEDDEEEYEKSDKGNRFLRFMFGNVDNSGDLDVDYLDEQQNQFPIPLFSYKYIQSLYFSNFKTLLFHSLNFTTIATSSILLPPTHMLKQCPSSADSFTNAPQMGCSNSTTESTYSILASPTKPYPTEYDEEEYEESGECNRFLGFMFGNVDNSGDLDVDYLDEDAKEHLSALADKLGPSLTDIDLSGKSPQTPHDVVDQGEVVCQEKLYRAVFDILLVSFFPLKI
ncbi:hypothetical protein RJT34_02834 [Clitoria ternatea]|uniref:TAFII-230 TBP-binding domain-containing protein n=1 Tax=Clitoria ternatea TaxID=43366 RepID=A0AAN9KJN8_CLITE